MSVIKKLHYLYNICISNILDRSIEFMASLFMSIVAILSGFIIFIILGFLTCELTMLFTPYIHWSDISTSLFMDISLFSGIGISYIILIIISIINIKRKVVSYWNNIPEK